MVKLLPALLAALLLALSASAMGASASAMDAGRKAAADARWAAFVARQKAEAGPGEDHLAALKKDLHVLERLFNRDPRMPKQFGVQAPGSLVLDARGEFGLKRAQENSSGVECALCGIAVNEVFGLMVENRSRQDIEDILKSDVCGILPSGSDERAVCDAIVAQLPMIEDRLENLWDVSQVCVDLKLCAVPFAGHKDPEPMPTLQFNLDLEPSKRWTKICSTPAYATQIRHLVYTMSHLTSNNGKLVSEFGDLVNDYFPTEYAAEIAGCAAAMGGGVNTGWMSLINIGYEVSDACTSIVAQNSDGQVYHARNLDFWSGYWLTSELRSASFELEYQKGGKTLFTTSTFPGFTGALSGIKKGTMSVTIDTRFYPGGPKDFFLEIVRAIQERDATMVTFCTRDALMLTAEGDWPAAVDRLSNTELIADVYYTTAGTKPDEGAVISRNWKNATNVWRLNTKAGTGRGKTYLLETNYDHWKPAPWFDDRRGPGDAAMNKIPQSGLDLKSLMGVTSTKPVLNLQTVYTILAHPASGDYISWRRYCGYGKDGGGCTQ